MKAVFVLIGAALLLASCGLMPTDAAQQEGPDGKPAYHVICAGLFNSMDTCVKTAEEKCPGGYRTLEGGPEAKAAADAAAEHGIKSYLSLPPVDRSMTFACK